jgi:hypothetical protein
LLLFWIVAMSWGSTLSYPSISPVWSACRRAVLFAIGRKISRRRSAFFPQYESLRTSVSCCPTCQDWNL